MTEKNDSPLRRLQGLRVLVVEDEALVAMLLEEYLSDLGCVIAASARRVGRALEWLTDATLDIAVLDVNVGGESVEPLAERLDARGIPFIFASGYGASGIGHQWVNRPVLQKPFTVHELQAALQEALG